MLLRSLIASFVLLTCLPLWADTVWLNNGDRLTGEIILLDGGKLALKTKYAGQVLIDWKDIDTLRSEKPLLIKREGLDSQHSRSLGAAGKGMVHLVNGKSETVPLASIRQMVPPRPVLKDRVWEGNLDAKLDMERNDDKTDEWKLKGDTRVEHGRWRHVMSGQFEKETKNGERTEDSWELEYDLDRFLTEHWFVRGSYDQENDEFQFFERQRSYGLGPGYRFWDNELGRFDLIAQLSRFQLESDEGNLDFNAYSFEWDFKRLIWGTRFELYSKAQLQVPQIDEVDYVLDSEFGLRYRLNDWARLSLLYELDQLRGLGQTDSDKHYLIGVGIGW
ncbi:hypothetical protein Pres01_19110 [Metapseudomonas resinovorans]|uniref:DUF481 domain-containing protein n=1 Tax=Metapseudomonas resinovorans TaxID=53412 RepID=UPI000985211D|nr:DUF481 domain-containing protein [Pseudomonas resinovorans]GLZ85860.1 hypothetical protein Pres01_19110 [Pseudomonas resinovorans]